MFLIRYICLFTLLLHIGLFMPQQATATQEYDLVVKDWKKGVPIQLKHSLFQLEQISGGITDQIVFKGKGSGAAGEISLSFYTLEGDGVYLPPGSMQGFQVDRQRRDFTVSAIVPAVLRGKAGAVQVTFAGERRAAFYLKVYF